MSGREKTKKWEKELLCMFVYMIMCKVQVGTTSLELITHTVSVSLWKHQQNNPSKEKIRYFFDIKMVKWPKFKEKTILIVWPNTFPLVVSVFETQPMKPWRFQLFVHVWCQIVFVFIEFNFIVLCGCNTPATHTPKLKTPTHKHTHTPSLIMNCLGVSFGHKNTYIMIE